MTSRTRSRRPVVPMLGLAILLCAAWCGFAHAATAYRVVLNSGEELANVTFTPDYEFKVLRLSSPAARAISFNDVRAIYDGERDVTAEILRNKPPAASSTSWASEKSEDYKIANRLRWHGGLSGGGNFSAPIGDYYDGFTSGVGYDVVALVPFTRSFGLRAAISRSGVKAAHEVDQAGFAVRVMRYTGSAFGYMHLSSAPGDRSMAYGYVGMGGVAHRMEYKPSGLSVTDSDFLVTGGIGVIKAVMPNLGLEAGLSFDEVFGRIEGSTTQLAYIFDVRTGVVFLF